MEAFLSGVVAGYGIAIPVGAIALLIVQVGIKCGFRCAFAAGAGAATADFLYAGLAVIGGVALSDTIQSAGDSFRFVSAGVLAAIAIVGLRRSSAPMTSVESPVVDRRELAKTYARFLGLTIINPTTVVYFAAVVIGLGVAADMGVGSGSVFAVGALLASLSWQTLLAWIGGFAGEKMTPVAQRVAVVAGNLMILGLAVLILVG